MHSGIYVTVSACCRPTPMGKEYIGIIDVTKSGRVCQRWDSDVPHMPNSLCKQEVNFADESIKAAANYCRSCDSTDEPWCYTMDPSKRWEKCDIPFCL